ncbi:MAG TPA: acyl-CoA dehydrogenase family protein [Ilumatobacteraceae bacterium]|jgi:alkylation response protein AidB-like acyl-CoA dehydrogenase
MTITNDTRQSGTAVTPNEVLAAASRLAPIIAGRGADIESARRVPRDILDRLIADGCFRITLPVSHGGSGADLPTAMRMAETLASGDASVAWITMLGATAWCDLAGLPRRSFDAIFAKNPDVIVAAVINPTGSITAVGDSYRVSGRWSFASGCEHADMLFGNCIEGTVDGVPQMRGAVLPADSVTIEDTWNVSGLCGTGSHHFRVDDLVVQRELTFRPLVDEPCIDEIAVHIPPPALISLSIASIALGIAQGALSDIVALALRKTPLLAPGPLATNSLFQSELATADTDLRAARALLYETAESLWAGATRGPLTLEQRARIRASAVWATERATGVVDTAYRAGGGSAIYTDNPLQRRFRDIHALTQHFLVRRDTMTTAGAILAGQDPKVMIF